MAPRAPFLCPRVPHRREVDTRGLRPGEPRVNARPPIGPRGAGEGLRRRRAPISFRSSFRCLRGSPCRPPW
jgi:hypothetical protein